MTLPNDLPDSHAPLSSNPFYECHQYNISIDRIVEGQYTAEALSSTEIVSNYPVQQGQPSQPRKWTLDQDLSAYPHFRSSAPLLDAVYNLSLSELKQDISSEGTFDAGAEWPGAWTRDASYSILLSLAAIAPEHARATLLKKVKRDRIVQDTGTGGSWPVSSDRICWALAAWEIYLVLGDKSWLEQSSTIVENSILDDEHVVIDPTSGLARGESSFLDWREQTYPRWMQPADIYSSQSLGTNALFYRSYRILALMDEELGKPERDWNSKANRIQSAINDRFWIAEKGFYGQYLYGCIWQTLSPRSDALGNALAVLFDIPTPARQYQLIQSQPLMPFGVPTVYPQAPNIPPYHNRSVWPFVQAFWSLAAAKCGDQSTLLHGLASIYRASALFLTNKENMVADSGRPVGTEVNSDRQLWSVAGSLAIVLRIFLGMEFLADGLHLHPVIPEPLKGTFALTQFRYRDATLTITVHGFGSKVQRMTIDDQESHPVIPPHMKGSHSVVLYLDNHFPITTARQVANDVTAPETPFVEILDDKLVWAPIPDASRYQIYRNGVPFQITQSNSVSVPGSSEPGCVQVAAINDSGCMSFLSQPRLVRDNPLIFAVQAAAPGSNETFITIEQTGATTGLSIAAILPKSGKYGLMIRYANGSGPISTGNMCAIRTLFMDGRMVGPVIMPQRGSDSWDEWGLTNAITLEATSGSHLFELRFLPHDLNMQSEINRARISSMLLIPLD